jgi:hypothetical protein
MPPKGPKKPPGAKPRKKQSAGAGPALPDENVIMCQYHTDAKGAYFLLKTQDERLYIYEVEDDSKIKEISQVCGLSPSRHGEGQGQGEEMTILQRLPSEMIKMICDKLEPKDRSNTSMACKDMNRAIDNERTLAAMVNKYLTYGTNKFVDVERRVVTRINALEQDYRMTKKAWERFFHRWYHIYTDEQWESTCEWYDLTDPDLDPYLASEYQSISQAAPGCCRTFDDTDDFKEQLEPFEVDTKLALYVEELAWMTYRVLIKETKQLCKQNKTRVYGVGAQKKMQTMVANKAKEEFCKALLYQRMLKLPSFWAGIFFGYSLDENDDRSSSARVSELVDLGDNKITRKLWDVIEKIEDVPPGQETNAWRSIRFNDAENVVNVIVYRDALQKMKEKLQEAITKQQQGGRRAKR